jgi:WD40 repeat protein
LESLLAAKRKLAVKNFLFFLLIMSLSLISIPVQSQPLDQLTLPPLSTPPMVQLTLPPLVPPPVEQEVKPITEKPNNLIISEKIIFSQEFSSNVFLIRAINKNTWQEEKLFTTLPDQQNKTVIMWEPSWAPDGKKAAYVLWYITGEIYLMSLDDQSTTRLTDNDFDDKNPAWSPDGTQIAFSTNRDDNYEIYLMDTRGTNQQKLTDNPSLDTEPCWSPDGKQILFTSDRSGTSNLYLLTLGQEYAEPFFLKGYMTQVEYFLKYLSDTAQPDDNVPNIILTFQQILTSATNLITQLTTYQLEFIEKPKYLIIWQADWVRVKE